MVIELTLANAIAIMGLLAAGIWGLVKVITIQHEKRITEQFVSLQAAIGNVGKEIKDERMATQQLERSFLEFKALLPRDYVRRDDFLQHIGTISTRIDNFALRMERALHQQREGL